MGHANGNTMQVQHAVKLRIRFVDAMYRVPFLVAERRSCPVIVGINFLNENVETV